MADPPDPSRSPVLHYATPKPPDENNPVVRSFALVFAYAVCLPAIVAGTWVLVSAILTIGHFIVAWPADALDRPEGKSVAQMLIGLLVTLAGYRWFTYILYADVDRKIATSTPDPSVTPRPSAFRLVLHVLFHALMSLVGIHILITGIVGILFVARNPPSFTSELAVILLWTALGGTTAGYALHALLHGPRRHPAS